VSSHITYAIIVSTSIALLIVTSFKEIMLWGSFYVNFKGHNLGVYLMLFIDYLKIQTVFFIVLRDILL
jgi:hypothetical protein